MVSLPLVALVSASWFLFGPSFAAAAGAEPAHGTISRLSEAKSKETAFCVHRVPADVCVKCHPDLAAEFKRAGDWCGEHAVPESQCYDCHPNLSFEPMPPLPEGADVREIAAKGEDPGALEKFVVPGKVTLFDYRAAWCMPCVEIERHLRKVLPDHPELAVRTLDVSTWKSPLARRHLAKAKGLPYLVLYGKDGKRAAEIQGLDLAALDKAIAEATK